MLRSVGGSIAACVLVAGCSFQATSPGNGSGAPVDAARADAAQIDAAPPGPRRKRITIEPSKVAGDQRDFPVWIALTDENLKQRASANGADIHFTKADGSPLAYEVQRWTPSTGRLEAWVRVDLADNAPTLLDLRYGDATRAHPPSSADVFSSSFEAVWHLDDALTTMVVRDSTNDGRHGMAMNGLGTDDQVPGKLGGAIDFDGTEPEQITFSNPYSGDGPHTISAWLYQRTPSNSDVIVAVGNAKQDESRWFHSAHQGRLAIGFYGNNWTGIGNDLVVGDWVLLHWVFEGSQENRSRIYRNGVQLATSQQSSGIDTKGGNGRIGWAPTPFDPSSAAPCGLDGILDEIRLSTAVRSAGWIATEYANQSSPQTFYSVGPEQLVE